MLRGGRTWKDRSVPLAWNSSLSTSVSSMGDLTHRQRRNDRPHVSPRVSHNSAIRRVGSCRRSISSISGSDDGGRRGEGLVKSKSLNSKHSRFSAEHLVTEAKIRGQLESTERELEHTKALLLEYKNHVENRLLSYIQNLEESHTKRERLCARLKRDNALLLEELERSRMKTTEVASTQLGTGKEKPCLMSSSPATSELRVDALPWKLQILRSREEGLLSQLREERAERERLEAQHAKTLTKLQELTAKQEQDWHFGVDGQTIEGLRNLLARRDEEIRQLRKTHGFSVIEAVNDGEQQHSDVTDSIAAELQGITADGSEFIEAMQMISSAVHSDHRLGAAVGTTDADVTLSGAAKEWDDARRAALSLQERASVSYLSQRPQLLLDTAKAMRRAMEKEHNEIALLVRELLGDNERLRRCLLLERHEWDVERQAAAHRLREVEEENTTLVHRLHQQNGGLAFRGSSWMRQGVTVSEERNKRERDALFDGATRCDAFTQTLLSEELLSVVLGSATARPVAGDMNHLLQNVEALERDNAAKATLIEQLQQQRERFLGGVDTDLALNLPVRSALTGTFSHYLLE